MPEFATQQYVPRAGNLDSVGDGELIPSGRQYQSTRVIHASRAGVILDADLSDVTAGTDQTAALQLILDTASADSPLELVIDGVARAKDLKVGAHTTLRGLGWSTGFVQAVGGYSCVRNKNYRSPYNGGTIVDENIVLRDFAINGNHLLASDNHLTSGSWLTNDNYLKANEDGQLVHPVKVYGCTNLTIENLYVFDPACYHINVANIDGGTFRNLQFNDSANAAAPFNGPNTAGLQVQGPCNDLVIENLCGDTSDDFLALNADDWNLVPDGDPSALQGAAGWGGGFSAVYKGDIVRVWIRNLSMNTASGIRLLSATSLIDQISIIGVKGTTTVYGIDTTPNISGVSGSGNIGRVEVSDFDVTPAAASVLPLIRLGANISRFSLTHWKLGPMTATINGVVLGGGTINQLVIDGARVDESSGSLSSCNLVTVTGGTAKQISISNVNWYRGALASAAVGVISQTGGTIGSLNLANVRVDLTAWIAVFTGGTCPSITSSNLTHTGNGGNASFVASGATVPRLRAAASNTSLLTATGGGGAFTSIKSDSTQDA